MSLIRFGDISTASAAPITTVYVPAVVGVPVIVPAVSIVRPVGSDPDNTLNVYEPLPPVADTLLV
jgi:hypothetical protein